MATASRHRKKVCAGFFNVYKHLVVFLIAYKNFAASTKRPEVSATLPRPPGHQKHVTKVNGSLKTRKPSPQEQQDIDDLLRSVQDVSYPSHKEEKTTKVSQVLRENAQTLQISQVLVYVNEPKFLPSTISQK